MIGEGEKVHGLERGKNPDVFGVTAFVYLTNDFSCSIPLKLKVTPDALKKSLSHTTFRLLRCLITHDVT